MNPLSSRRFRRLTGLLAGGWAVLAIVAATFSLIEQLGEPVLPVDLAMITGRAVVQSATPRRRGRRHPPG